MMHCPGVRALQIVAATCSGSLPPRVRRCGARPAVGRNTVNFTTTQAIDEAAVRAGSADLPRRSGATVSIDFSVHYVARTSLILHVD
jgi:hypothetical protein